MKRILCILAAVGMMFAVGCRHADQGEDVVSIVSESPAATAPAETEKSVPTPAPVDMTDENAVCFDNGVFVKGSFNWEFFFAKTRARMNARVRILNARDGGVEDMNLVFEDGAYTLTMGAENVRYACLTGGEFDMPEASGLASAKIYILTDDPGMTVEAFFGGSIPADVALGYTTASGTVIFVAYKTN